MRKRLIAIVLCVQMLLSLLASTSVVFASEIVSPSTDEPVQENSLTKTDSTSGEDESTPGEGEGTPGEGEGTPGESESTSGEGEGTPGEGESTPGEGESTSGEGESTPGKEEGSSQTLTIPVKELTWLSYKDALIEEANRACIDPSIYVGYTAKFNVNDWDTFAFFPSLEDIKGETEPTYLDIDNTDLTDVTIVISDYYVTSLYDEEYDVETHAIWYKINALSESVIPEDSYVLYYDEFYEDPPSLLIQPKKAMFAKDNVIINKQAVAASTFKELPTKSLPEFFDVTWHVGVSDDQNQGVSMYDLGDISSWEGIPSSEYRYVAEEFITLIPPEVTVAYETLLQAEDMDSYNAIYNSLPEYVRQMFSEKHLTNLEKHTETLVNREYTAIVELNGKTIPVSVRGPLPAGASLSVTPVSGETILNADFDIHSATEIIAALDIRIVFDDNTEWQPADGQYVAVSIGMTELGYEDGDIVRLHHQHEGDIFTYNVFVVLDGCVTYWTNGFSIYVVSAPNVNNTNGTQVQNDGTYTLEVGNEDKNEVVFYRPSSNSAGGTYTYGTWVVEDPTGAIYHTVHSNGNPSSNTMSVPWIKINALKATIKNDQTDTRVKLRFYYGGSNNYEEYTLNITAPKKGQNTLYLKDMVNTTGTIVATLVDGNGNEIANGLDGASFSWTRSDNLFIVPQAYTADYSGVNIAVDHAGLVEARKINGEYTLVTYTVKAILADGEELEASYTVYYQSEIINADFESPNAPSVNRGSSYTFFPNGYDGLYWKTSAPGTGSKRSNDIEYGDVTNATQKNRNGSTGSTDFGVIQAADAASGGTQFAELNAEAFGALYQDIITAPREDLDWSFAHAPRPPSSWASSTTNKMFIVIGATEDAQKLTSQAQLEALGDAAIAAAQTANISTAFMAGTASVDVTYNGATYKVWYHDAGTIEHDRNYDYDFDNYYSAAQNYGWAQLSGTYTVPDNQYRTRVFFVSDPPNATNSQNSGNLIDTSRAGQYKKYLIEYYEETIKNGEQSLKHLSEYDEKGEKLIYSSAEIINLDKFVNNETGDSSIDNLFLHEILVNGELYPYDIRYNAEDLEDAFDYKNAAIYITKYIGTPADPLNPDSTEPVERYKGYDIVVQVFLRDTVVAVDKLLVFPNEMTIEQKRTLMNDLTTPNPEEPGKVLGYQAEFELHSIKNLTVDNTGSPPTYTYDYTTASDNKMHYVATGSTLLTSLDPNGNCTGYVSIEKENSIGGRELPISGAYVLEETATSELVGLVLETVELTAKTFSYNNGDDVISQSYTVYTDSGTDNPDGPPTTPPDLISLPFVLEDTAKIAQVSVVNTYREKLTQINYKAIGNGKVKLDKADANYEDTPSETLKFYSGKAIGAVGHAAKNATFVGWFLDEACTQEVPDGTSAYGVYNKAAHTFKPNANIISEEVITFYALFETGTITIERTNAEPGQVFVYHIHRDEKTTTTETETGTQTYPVPALDMFVTVVCGNDGTGSTTVYEVPLGEYTVTELPDFAWRYDNKREITKEHEFNTDGTVKDLNLTYKFGEDNENWSKLWLNDFDTKPNVSKHPKPTGGSD